MKSVFKILGIALAGLLLSAPMGRADTIVAVTETHYDTLNRPDCVAIRMDPTTFNNAPANACNLVSAAGANGADRITRTVYDNLSHVSQVIQGVGTSVQRVYATYGYSDNGQVVDSVDANGNRTHLIYDGFDRLAEFDYPSTIRPSAFNPSTQATALATAGTYNTVACTTANTADCEAYAYDANGNKTYTRRRDKAVIYDCFDALNRGIKHFVSGTNGCPTTGSAADVYSTYDLAGHVTGKTFVSAAGTGVTYAYDGLGRISTTTDANGRTVAYLYNQASARTQLTLPDGNYVGYALDNASRVSTVGWNATSGLYSLTIDSLGRRTQLNRGGVAPTNYTYDALGRLTTFQFDPAVTSSDVTWSFTYNPANQIVNWSGTHPGYDYVETTSTTVPQTYDGLNRDAAIAAVSDGYDKRGNLTHDAPNGTARYFAYDVENRLLTKGPSTSASDLTLTYDPEGRLSGYTTSSGTTTFLYDGVNLIREYSGTTSTVQRSYVFGPGTDEPIVWFEGAGTADTRFLVANYQGSIIGYTGVTGYLQTVYKYGPYGEPKDINNADGWTTGRSRFAYTGQIMLPEAKLYYYKARVYDPNYGHFMQTDPIGSKDDLDLYAYTGDDPVDRSDPTGNEAASYSVYGRGPDTDLNRVPKWMWKASGYFILGASMLDGLGEAYIVEEEVAAGVAEREAAEAAAKKGVTETAEKDTAESAAQKPAAQKPAARKPAARCCFAAGTMISTDDGLRPIETMKVGDLVLSKDAVTGKTAPKPVLRIIELHNRDIYRLSFESKHGDVVSKSAIKTTDDHPWRTSDNKWVATSELKVGDLIQTLSGDLVSVVSIEDTGHVEPTYNLEVADFHTYFVGLGQLWVHNEGCGKDAIRDGDKTKSGTSEPNPHPKRITPPDEQRPRTTGGVIIKIIYILIKIFGH